MSNLRFLADMNISPKTIEALRQRGWDIIRVSEILPMDASDQEILDLARQGGRILVTQDLDFSALLALGGHQYPSLITLRLFISAPETVEQRPMEIPSQVKQALQEVCAVTIEDAAMRVRKLPID